MSRLKKLFSNYFTKEAKDKDSNEIFKSTLKNFKFLFIKQYNKSTKDKDVNKPLYRTVQHSNNVFKLITHYSSLITLLLIIHCSLFTFHCSAQDWLWAKTAGGTKNAAAYSIATDDSGNVIVAGTYKSKTITFGDTTFLNPDSIEHIFLVKYSTQGNVIWARSDVGDDVCEATSIANDKSGNIYLVGGFFSASITFDTITLNNPNPHYGDMFIVKYNSKGKALWGKNALGNSGNSATSVATDSIGNVFVTGRINGDSIIFGSFILYSYNRGASIFFVKYSDTGKVLWALSNGEQGEGGIDETYVTTDASGNVYLAGVFEGQQISFGDTILSITKIGVGNLFLVKFDSSGNVLWAKKFGGNVADDVNVSSVTTDVYGNIYFAGEFGDWIDIGTYKFRAAVQDMILVKVDKTGKLLWATRSIGNQTDYSTSIATDKSGNIFMTGYFYSDTIAFDSIKLINNVANDMFLVKYNDAGHVDWALAGNGGNYIFAEAVATDVSGDIYVGGYFGGHIIFGSTEFTCVGCSNIFIAKLAYNTGIANLSNNSNISIYPNPADNYFNIEITGYNRETNYDLYNLLGEKVNSGKINTPISRINVSGLNDGIYILELYNSEFDTSRKILINH